MKKQKIAAWAAALMLLACGCAQAETKTHSVTFVQNGWDDIVIQVKDGADLSAADFPAPKSRIGYKTEWNVQELIGVKEDVTITCEETPKTYEVTFNALGGTLKNSAGETLSSDKMSFVYDASYEFPAVERDGFRFAGWYFWKMIKPDQAVLDLYREIESSGVWNVCNEKNGVCAVTIFATWEYDIIFRQEGFEDKILTYSQTPNGSTSPKTEDIPEPEKEEGCTVTWNLSEEMERLNKTTIIYAKKTPAGGRENLPDNRKDDDYWSENR